MSSISAMAQWMLLFIILVSPVLAVPKVVLNGVTVIGQSLGSSQEAFRGIPFAEPPVGSLRLKPPVPKIFASSVINATTFGPSCLQALIPYSHIVNTSEDCLTINLQRPTRVQRGAKLPVMAWIHGGAFTSGTGSDWQFNATNLINQSVSRGTPVIYVNFNYRLGPLGFPVGQEAERRGAFNLGLKDQLLALEWIQRHIESFGGDKSKVTLYGESAGAFSVGLHMVNPKFKTLARAAILESGAATAKLPCSVYCDKPDAGWANFVRAIPECQNSLNDSITCIRTKASQESLDNAIKAVTGWNTPLVFSPTVDGPRGILPDDPLRLINAGKFARIPVISGTNLDEGTLFPDTSINSTRDIISTVKGMFPPSPELSWATDQLLKLYPDVPALGSPFNTGNETFGLNSLFKRMSAIMGDVMFVARQRFMNTKFSKAGINVYGYRFSDPQTTQPPFLGVAHSFELDYVYGNPNPNATSSAKALSAQMLDYWLSFATSLTPNDGRGLPRPTWPKYGGKVPKILDLHGATKPIPDNFRDKQISFIIDHLDLFRL